MGNLSTSGFVDATGNISGGNINTANLVSAGDVSSSNSIVAVGNISGGNLTVVSQVTAADVNVSGNVTTDLLVANTAQAPLVITNEIRSDDSTLVVVDDSLQINNDLIVLGAITVPELIAVGNIVGGNLITAGNGNIATLTVSTFANVTATTAATSNATGALRVAGGVGIKGDLFAADMYSNDELVLTELSTVDGGQF